MFMVKTDANITSSTSKQTLSSQQMHMFSKLGFLWSFQNIMEIVRDIVVRMTLTFMVEILSSVEDYFYIHWSSLLLWCRKWMQGVVVDCVIFWSVEMCGVRNCVIVKVMTNLKFWRENVKLQRSSKLKKLMSQNFGTDYIAHKTSINSGKFTSSSPWGSRQLFIPACHLITLQTDSIVTQIVTNP